MITETEARHIASEWHGGQGSPFYAFSSSGHVDRVGMERETAECLRLLTGSGQYSDEDIATESERLTTLREYVAAHHPYDEDDA